LFACVFTADEIDAVKRSLGQVNDLAGSAAGQRDQTLALHEEWLSRSEIGRRLGLSRHAVARVLKDS
jgi:hypothetical protein